jgi:hypothetical protein
MDDQLQSLLLQALAPGGAPVSGVLEQALGQDGGDDPRALLAQYLLQRQADDDDLTDDVDVDLVLSVGDHYELEELRRRNEVFAAAVGACELCWGDDPGCRVCRGRGRPGWAEPNRRLFAEVAGPAIRRLRRRATDAV